jgi:hypothetical protein
MWTALLYRKSWDQSEEPPTIHAHKAESIRIAARAMASYYHAHVVILKDGVEVEVVYPTTRGKERKPLTLWTPEGYLRKRVGK